MQNTECAYISEQFTDYNENTITQEVKAKVDDHLANCSPCNAVYQELTSVLEKLHTLPVMHTSDSFSDTLLSQINSFNSETNWQKIFRSQYTRVASYAIAAGLIVALGLNFWIDPISPLTPNGQNHFAEEAPQQDPASEGLAEMGDSTHNEILDSLSLSPNTINSAKTALQLVSGQK